MRVLGGLIGLALMMAPGALAQPAACTDRIDLSTTCEYTVGQLADGKVEADDLKIPLNSPTTPAGAIIGDDDLALTTIRPSSDLTPQLLGAFNSNFELQPGVAIGGTPYWWFEPKETITEYRETSSFERVLKRTQFGLATKLAPGEGEGDADGALLGVSLGWQLFDDQDVRAGNFEEAERCLVQQIDVAIGPEVVDPIRAQRALVAERLFKSNPAPIRKAVVDLGMTLDADAYSRSWFFRTSQGRRAIAEAENPRSGEDNGYADQIDAGMKALTADEKKEAEKLLGDRKFDEEGFKKAVDACGKKYDRKLTESPSLMLNVAAGFASDTGKFDNLAPERTALWLTYNSGTPSKDPNRIKDPDYKEPFNVFGAPVIGFASYSVNEKLVLPNDVKVEADRLSLGVGTSFKSGEDEAFDFQASFIRTEFDTNIPRSSDYRVSLSYSRKISKYLWLEARAGTTNSDELDDATFAGISLKVDWAAMLAAQR